MYMFFGVVVIILSIGVFPFGVWVGRTELEADIIGAIITAISAAVSLGVVTWFNHKTTQGLKQGLAAIAHRREAEIRAYFQDREVMQALKEITAVCLREAKNGARQPTSMDDSNLSQPAINWSTFYNDIGPKAIAVFPSLEANINELNRRKWVVSNRSRWVRTIRNHSDVYTVRTMYSDFDSTGNEEDRLWNDLLARINILMSQKYPSLSLQNEPL